MMIVRWLLLISCLISTVIPAEIVTTSYGQLEGTTVTAGNGQNVHMFMGIPQIQAPTGENRLKMPKRPIKWEGTLKATEYKAACPSNSTKSASPQKVMDEDCVYLNVFTSDNCLKGNVSCPVMVYLHGGSLNYDSAVMFNTSFIVEQYVAKDILFVLPSFRLGSLALLHFENETLVPRNLPLYDLLHGLTFVHEEIHNFGGNKSRVTLAGHSMGGCLVYALALAPDIDPEAKLFQQIMPLSGPFYYLTAQAHLNNSRKILEKAGCLLPSETASLFCFSKLSWQDILRAQRAAEEDGYELIGMSLAAPVGSLDEDFRAKIEATPKRNILAGSTSMEFFYKEDYYGLEVGRFIGLKNNEGLLKKFVADRRDEKHPASKFLSYQSQEVFVPAAYYGATMENKGGSAWLYEFDDDEPAGHAKDMMYFIGNHPRPMTPDRQVIMNIYSQGIVNFVRGERPMKDWLPLNGTSANYLHIRSNISAGIAPRMMADYHRPEMDYWVREMTDYDEMLSHQSAASWALPLAIGVVLFTVICVVGIIFCVNNKPQSAERRPLLAE